MVFVFVCFLMRTDMKSPYGLNTFYQFFFLSVSHSQYAIEVQLGYPSLDRIKFLCKNESTTAKMLAFGV